MPFSTVSRPSDSGWRAGFAAAGWPRRRGGELPVRFALGVDLQDDPGFDERHLADLDTPASKASSEGFTVTDFTSTMLGFFDPGRIEELDAVELDAGRRQQRQADRTLDGDVTTRCALYLRDDLGLVGIDVDEGGQGQQRHDQHADEATGADQKSLALAVCHGISPRTPTILAYRSSADCAVSMPGSRDEPGAEGARR